jgi:hypothetical protein
MFHYFLQIPMFR